MERQMVADDSCGPLAQAVDAAIDEAISAFAAGETDQGIALVYAADSAADELLQVMGLPDADEDEDEQQSTGMIQMNSVALGGASRSEERATWSTAFINNLPDSSFLYIAPGGSKDSDGKTTPRSLRHFPVKDADGKVDLPHLRNALARIPQSDLPDAVKASCTSKAQRLLRAAGGAMNSTDPDGEIREYSFEAQAHGDGLTLEGYAAVFNSPTRISGWDGDFDEVIRQGAFARTLRQRTPVLMFNHGRHPLIGDIPLGVIQRAQEDSRGVHIQARLSDNWLIQPVRDAVADGSVHGMSFRFTVPQGGDTWQERKGNVPLRSLNDLDCPELGPVVFPAYEPTTAMVRSALDRLTHFTGRPGAGSAGGGDPRRRRDHAAAVVPLDAQARHRALLMRGIIRRA